MRSWIRFHGAVLAAALIVSPAAAQESGARFELSWQAPDECPEETTFRSQVLRLAGHDTPPGSELLAKVNIERSAADGFKLTLQTESDGRSGSRILEGSSCGAVVDAAALTLALILNPEAVVAASSPEPAPDPRVDAPAPASKSEPERPSQGPPVRLVAGPELGVQGGAMPSIGPTLALSVGIGVGDGWAWLTGSYAWLQHASVAGQPETGGKLWMISATALGCWDLAPSALVLAPCAGAELSRVQGEGEGVTHPQEAAVYWPSGAFGGAVEFELKRPLVLRFSALGLVPLKQPGLFLEQIDEAGNVHEVEVHRPARIGGRVQLGLLVDFL